MTSKELATTNENEIVNYKTSNGTEIKLTPRIVLDTIANGQKFITDNEVILFMEICKNQKSNPFLRESYLIKYDETKPAQNVTGLGFFERVADEHPQYDGKRDGIIVQNTKGEIIERLGCMKYPNEILLGGWCEVYRKDRKFPTITRLSLSEYSKGQSTWKQLPTVMINKCAKVGALRTAFPSQFNGCYAEEELVATGEVHPIDNNLYDIDDTPEPKVVTDNPFENKITAPIIGETPKEIIISQEPVIATQSTKTVKHITKEDLQADIKPTTSEKPTVDKCIKKEEKVANKTNDKPIDHIDELGEEIDNPFDDLIEEALEKEQVDDGKIYCAECGVEITFPKSVKYYTEHPEAERLCYKCHMASKKK